MLLALASAATAAVVGVQRSDEKGQGAGHQDGDGRQLQAGHLVRRLAAGPVVEVHVVVAVQIQQHLQVAKTVATLLELLSKRPFLKQVSNFIQRGIESQMQSAKS